MSPDIAPSRQGEAPSRGADNRVDDLLARSTGFFERCLWETAEAMPVRSYLAARGLGPDTLRAFAVGYAPNSWHGLLHAAARAGFSAEHCQAAGLAQIARTGNPIDRFRGRIMFPIADLDGRTRGYGARATTPHQQVRYLNSPAAPGFAKSELLYGAALARPAARTAGVVVACEGYIDTLALHQAGVTNAVGTMGTSLTTPQAAALRGLAPRVAFALDADPPGQQAELRAGTLAARHGLDVRHVSVAPGCDPADLLAESGPDALRRAVDDHVPFALFEARQALSSTDLSDASSVDQALDGLRDTIGAADEQLRHQLHRTIAEELGVDIADIARWTAPRDPVDHSPPPLGTRRASGGESHERERRIENERLRAASDDRGMEIER